MEAFVLAFEALLDVQNVLYLCIGVAAGIILGAIPGLSASMAIAIVIPFTFTLPPVASLIMMMGAYKGGIYGGSIAAILLNAPGTAAAVATVQDGHALAKQGKGLKALKVSLFSSAIGDTFSDIVLILSAAQLARVALEFGPIEFTVIAIVSLTLVVSLSGKSLTKGLIGAALGILVAFIGLDPMSGLPRLTFGSSDFYGGVGLVPMLLGLLPMTEVLIRLEKKQETKGAFLPHPKVPSDAKVTKSDWKRIAKPITAGSIVGTIVGIIPGMGPTIGAVLGYDNAKKLSKDKKAFGKGSIEGVAGAESGNNAVSGANLIPLLGLGIPGDSEAVILIGAFLIHGLTPGPMIFRENPEVVYGLYGGLVAANLLLVMFALLLLPQFIKLSSIRTSRILPVVMILATMGAYNYQQSFFDVAVAFAFCGIGYLMHKIDAPRSTVMIGFILAPILENNFRRAMLITDNDWSAFFSSSIGNFLWMLAIASIVYSIAVLSRKRR
ncbi:MAG: tripartite tricarboxylate transporter permease [Gammaproteobacteria bacterium]|nr:tripartite tricarboxylate transporter permease [Gammaproteobacteria bacterium]